MDSQVIGAKHIAANSCSSSTTTGSEEEDDVVIEGCSYSNSNLKRTPRQQILNSRTLDLDLFPLGRDSLVECKPNNTLGPQLDHGLEDGVRPSCLLNNSSGLHKDLSSFRLKTRPGEGETDYTLSVSSDSVRRCRLTPSGAVSSQRRMDARVVPIGKTAQDLTTAKRVVISSGKTTAREKPRSPDRGEQDDCQPVLWERFLSQGSPQGLLATVDTATATGSPSPAGCLKHYSPAVGSSSPVDCSAAVKWKLAMSSPSSAAAIPYPSVIFPLPADPSPVATPSLLLSPPPVDALLSPVALFPAAFPPTVTN